MDNAEMVNTVKTALNTHERKVSKKRAYVPSTSNPREELRRLVRQHKALTKASTAINHMASDRTNRTTGEKIKCNLPDDVAAMFKQVARDGAKKRAKSLEADMKKVLKDIPIYQHFLGEVFGVGPVVAAYLISEIDIHRAVKSSALRRFCGLAVINGRLERHTAGVKSGYCAEIRTRLFQAFTAMYKNGAQYSKTCKYLDVWANAKHRKLQSAVNGMVSNGVREVSAKGYAHKYGWHKAADVLIEDLYTVWRTLEGLEVWPSYYAAKLGYEHGGKISVNAPRKLTLDEALALVGDVGGRAHTWTPAEAAVAEALDEEGDEE